MPQPPPFKRVIWRVLSFPYKKLAYSSVHRRFSFFPCPTPAIPLLWFPEIISELNSLPPGPCFQP